MEKSKAPNAREIGPMSEAVSAELRAELARKKYTVARLAKESGMARSTLHKTLKAERVVDVEDLYAICDFLGVEPAAVIDAATAATRAIVDDGLLPGERLGVPAALNDDGTAAPSINEIAEAGLANFESTLPHPQEAEKR